MKYLIVLIVCIASGVTAQKFNRNCSTLVTAKLPTAPKVGVWYLVAREKRPDAFNCYNIKISVKTGTTLTIVASLMADKYVLNNTFNAVPNKNGAWDITTTDGKPSAQIAMLTVDTNICIFSCMQYSVIIIPLGCYNPKKVIDKAGVDKILKDQSIAGLLTATTLEVIDNSKCTN